MKIFITFAFTLLFLNSYCLFAENIEEPDDFEQMEAKITAITDIKFKLAIFEKIGDKWIGCCVNRDDEFEFFESDNNLNIKKLSKLKINYDENILSYKINGNNINLIFGQRDDGYYAKSVVFDYVNGKVLNSQMVYALVREGDFDVNSWNKKLGYTVADNKDQILIKDLNKNEINFGDLKVVKVFENKKTGVTLIYNFLKSYNDNLDIYYSLVSKDGNLIKAERKTLIEKAYDNYRNPYGFYAGLSDDNTPYFFVDYGNKNERFISCYSIKNEELSAATTNHPIEINGETNHYIKSAKNDGNPLSIWALICENKDDFSDTYGLIKFNLSDDMKSLKSELKFWSKDEIEKITNDNDLASNMISDIIVADDEYYLLIEANESYIVYEQGMNHPVNRLKEALVLKLNKSYETIWSNYIKNRKIERLTNCDNSSNIYLQTELRFALKFDKTLNNEYIGFYYHDLNDDEIFAQRILNKSNGVMISNKKLFNIDKYLFLYPDRIFKSENQTLMYLSEDCDSYILKFE
jgi:hypothetical protein